MYLDSVKRTHQNLLIRPLECASIKLEPFKINTKWIYLFFYLGFLLWLIGIFVMFYHSKIHINIGLRAYENIGRVEVQICSCNIKLLSDIFKIFGRLRLLGMFKYFIEDWGLHFQYVFRPSEVEKWKILGSILVWFPLSGRQQKTISKREGSDGKSFSIWISPFWHPKWENISFFFDISIYVISSKYF